MAVQVISSERTSPVLTMSLRTVVWSNPKCPAIANRRHDTIKQKVTKATVLLGLAEDRCACRHPVGSGKC
jgi:hypothetical protein